jgi:hypothetical protein
MPNNVFSRPSAVLGKATQWLRLITVTSLAIAGLQAQSITSGDVTGAVKDPSGAAMPNATVTLKNIGTGVTQTQTTSGQGQYRFSLVSPGNYTVSASAAGFSPAEVTGVVVVAGQPSTVNFQMRLAASTTTIQVSEAASVVQSENADVSTAFNTQQILNMPNPGGDLTYVAQTAPGVVMNTQGGYGNFSSAGMPATSNLFSVNGANFNDPYLNLNNSGASNLMLGFNDVSEANVIDNAYSAQYGQYAGAQVTYQTKSGTNEFHGDAIYMWNGRAVNANDFIDNLSGNGRPFLNFNQWATGIQGPIWKNRTFFDADYEGTRVVLPTSPVLVKVPSPQFQAATLSNLAAKGNAAEIPFYQQLFKIQNGAPGIASATPAPGGGCGSGSSKVSLPGGAPCTLEFRVTPPNAEREYQYAIRVDHNFSDRDRGYVRVWRDNGFQPTYTDYFSPIFNAESLQPQMAAQVSENHTFSPTAVNQFTGSAWFYAAAFHPSDITAALNALPTVVEISGSPLSRVGGENYAFPQGRRVFQYQVIDDFSKTAGKHTFRLGFSWLHDNITELGLNEYINGRITVGSLLQFYNGGGATTLIRQRFPTATEEPFLFNTFGGYAADDWKVSDRLTVSLNLRLENYANPVCRHNCFSRLATPFTGYPVNPATPYNQSVLFNQHDAFSNTQAIIYEPRVGIAWKPSSSGNTVVRTGAGVFADELPGNLAQAAAIQMPNVNVFSIRGSQTSSGFGAIAPGVPNSLFTAAAQANAALLSQFANGGTLQSIKTAFPGFVSPNMIGFPSTFKQPTYYKWNFEIQQGFGSKMMLSINYSGMHGNFIPIADNGLNAYCPASTCPTGFTGLPASAADPRFGTVTQYLSGGISNYNGLIVSLQRRMSRSLTWNLNYTWSHAQDDASNGGLLSVNEGEAPSVLNPQNPYNVRANYGSSDLDVRHYLSFGFVATDIFSHGMHWGPAKRILGGWTLTGSLFYRTGLPYTATDSGATSLLNNYGGTVFASVLPNQQVGSCGVNAVTDANGNVNSPCLTLAQFAPSGYSFGNQGRNDFRGPNFFDMDLALMKDIKFTERVTFSFGAQAFNVLNHPNFDQPINDINNPNFGQIQTMVGPPTSILGSFVGGSNSPRFLEIRGMLRF